MVLALILVLIIELHYYYYSLYGDRVSTVDKDAKLCGWDDESWTLRPEPLQASIRFPDPRQDPHGTCRKVSRSTPGPTRAYFGEGRVQVLGANVVNVPDN